MLALELTEQHRHHGASRPGRGAEHELTAQHAVVARQLFEELPLESKHPLSSPVQPVAGLRGLDPPAGTVEQPRPEPFLE